MKTKLLFAAFAALLTAGCSQNEIMEVSPDAAPAVGFKVFTDAQTRGDVTNSTGIQSTGFGVFAYHTKQSVWNNAGAFTPNFMYNQKVEYKNSAWEYAPVKYWPNTEGDKISFFAYAPHSSMANSGITFTTTTTTATGAPKLNFTLQNTPLQMVDLVATNAAQTGNDKAIDRTKTTGKVAFNLKHVLTRASFKAKLEASLASSPTHVFITGMRILGTDKRDDTNNTGNSVAANSASKFYNAGIYQWSDGTWSTTTGLTAQAAPYALDDILNKAAATGVTGYTTQSIELPQAATATSLFKSSHYLFLIPPANTTGIAAATDVRVQLDYDIVTVDNNLAQKYSITSTTATVSLPNGTLKLGTAYEFTFTVGLEKVQVSASVADWATPVAVSIPTAEAASNAAAIVTAIGTLNTTKAADRNCNYFVVNCSGMSGLNTLNLSAATVTNFASGDKIELNFLTNPGVTDLTLPTGWKADKTSLSAVGKIILTKN